MRGILAWLLVVIVILSAYSAQYEAEIADRSRYCDAVKRGEVDDYRHIYRTECLK